MLLISINWIKFSHLLHKISRKTHFRMEFDPSSYLKFVPFIRACTLNIELPTKYDYLMFWWNDVFVVTQLIFTGWAVAWQRASLCQGGFWVGCHHPYKWGPWRVWTRRPSWPSSLQRAPWAQKQGRTTYGSTTKNWREQRTVAERTHIFANQRLGGRIHKNEHFQALVGAFIKLNA